MRYLTDCSTSQARNLKTFADINNRGASVRGGASKRKRAILHRSSNIVQFKFAGILNSDYRSERKRIIQSWRYVRPVSSHDRNSYDWCTRAHGDACITMHLVGGRDHTARGSDTKLTCG